MSSGKRYKFIGSSFGVQTGLGSPVDVTGASATDPVVITAAAHGLVLADVVQLDGFVAPTQLDGAIYPVDNPASGTFEVPVDGSDWEVFDAGSPGATATPVTFSDFCELTGTNQQDGGADQYDASTICSDAKEFEQGLSDSGTLQLDFNWAGNQPVQVALREAKKTGEKLAFKVTFPTDGGTVIMVGTVQQTSFSGSVSDGLWRASATIKLSGEVYVLEAA